MAALQPEASLLLSHNARITGKMAHVTAFSIPTMDRLLIP